MSFGRWCCSWTHISCGFLVYCFVFVLFRDIVIYVNVCFSYCMSAALPECSKLRGQKKESHPFLEMIVRHHVGLLESSRCSNLWSIPTPPAVGFFPSRACAVFSGPGSTPIKWRNFRRRVGTVPDLCMLIVLGCQACMQGSDITTASSVFRILPQYLLFSILEQIFTSHIGWQCRLGTFVKFRIEISFLEAWLGKRTLLIAWNVSIVSF